MTIKDFGLISLLACKGVKYDHYTVDELGRIWFTYPNSPVVEAVRSGFYTNTATVPIQDFLNAQATMKTLIYDIRREGSNYDKSTEYRIA